MLPILQAEETLTNITSYAVGGGNLKKEDSTRIVNQLTTQTRQRDEKQSEPSIDKKLMTLSSMGIGIVDTRKNKGQGGDADEVKKDSQKEDTSMGEVKVV